MRILSVLLISALALAGCAGGPTGTPKVGAGVSGALTVACYDSMMQRNFLEQAAAGFMEKYPDTEVVVESFSEMPEIKTMEGENTKMTMVQIGDDTQSKSDYISKVNTELMSGKGADVLLMDVLPYYRYAEKKQIENLREYMDGDDGFDMSEYWGNVIDAMEYGGGLYAIPMDFAFNMFMYDKTLLTDEQIEKVTSGERLTYERLMDIGGQTVATAKEGSEVPVWVFASSMDRFFTTLFKENYSAFVDLQGKKANFTDGAFVSLLERLGGYAEREWIDSQKMANIGEAADFSPGQTTMQFRQELSMFKSYMSMNLLNRFNTDDNRKRGGTMMAVYGGGGGMPTEDDEIAGLVSDASGGYPFTVSRALSINSNSSEKELAWEFIKYLLSFDVQSSMQMMNDSINRDAGAERAKHQITGEMFFQKDIDQVPLSQGRARDLDDDEQTVFDNYWEAFEGYVTKLDTYNAEDATVEALIKAETEGFFEGKRQAGEVAASLQNKISLYLNE